MEKDASGRCHSSSDAALILTCAIQHFFKWSTSPQEAITATNDAFLCRIGMSIKGCLIRSWGWDKAANRLLSSPSICCCMLYLSLRNGTGSYTSCWKYFMPSSISNYVIPLWLLLLKAWITSKALNSSLVRGTNIHSKFLFSVPPGYPVYV